MLTLTDKLRALSALRSPSGAESAVREFLEQQLSSYVDKSEVDGLGNLVLYKYAANRDSAKTLMLVAHMDEVAMMVSLIEENGYIRVSKVGGIDENIMRGQEVVILHDGSPISGVIGSIPFHMKKDNPQKDIDISDLWIDLGASSKDEESRIVAVGDYVLVDSGFRLLENDCVCAPACDDKVGVSALWDVLEKLHKEVLNINLVVVFSAQEEIGLRGAKVAAFSLRPDVCIAVDVTHASDYPCVNKIKYGDIRLGKGIVVPIGPDFSPSVQNQIIQVANSNKILVQRLAQPMSSGTDIHAIQNETRGCLTGLVSIPCRYMHSPVEVVSTDDIMNCADLLYQYVTQYDSNK